MPNDSFEKMKAVFENYGLGEHFCSIYKSKAEQFSVILPYVYVGLKRNEKCIYIVDDRTKEELLDAFIDSGVDIKKYIKSGQMLFLTKNDSYLKKGFFDPYLMIDLLKENETKALKEGYAGLRVTGEMTWVLTPATGTDRLIEYENALNTYFPGSKCMAICQYNEEKFNTDILRHIVYTHPRTLIYGSLYENFYYIPPDILFETNEGKLADKFYKTMVANIINFSKKNEEIISLSRFPSENPNPVLRIDKSGNILYKNLVVESMLKNENLTQEDIYKILPYNLMAEINKALETQKSIYDLDVNVAGKTYSYYIAPVSTEMYVNLYGLDITDSKKAEEELQRFRILIDMASDGVFIIDPETGYFLDINKTACKMTGYSREELLNMKVTDLDTVLPDDFSWQTHIKKVKKYGEVTLEGSHRRKNGTSYPVEVNVNYVNICSVNYLVALVRDITERKKLDNLKNEFVSTVSHELRTPITVIKSGIDIILDNIIGDINSKQKDVLLRSKNSVDRLSRIVSDLLDISKIESGHLELRKKVFNLADTITETARPFKTKLDEKGVELRINLLNKNLKVYADPDKIIQIITNLISNSAKFTDKGYVEVSACLKGTEIECFVKDTGRGIAKNDMPKLFNKFEQFGRIAGAGERGTGLGLAITKNLVNMHDGKIFVKSTLNKGTKITFTLPVYRSEDQKTQTIDRRPKTEKQRP